MYINRAALDCLVDGAKTSTFRRINTHPIKLKEAVETFASCKASLDFFEKIKPVTVIFFFFFSSSSVVLSRSSSS
jgi:UDP-N-acetylglucosamine:LPS N-acetylglucosamine transferase